MTSPHTKSGGTPWTVAQHWRNNWETWAFGLSIALTTCLWLTWRYVVADLILGAVAGQSSVGANERLAQLGQLGDMFGGINALFTAWAFAGVIWTGLLQRRDIAMQALDQQESRTVLREQQTVMQEQQAVAARQQFEATFFNLLNQLRGMTDQVSLGSLSGPSALNSMAADITGTVINSRQGGSSRVALVLADDRYRELYEQLEATLGPYFRSMYHAFKFVDLAAIEPDEKVRYSNIARAQLSEGAVLLLALNALTPPGHGFKDRVERYGLLKHLSRRDRELYLEALLEVYQPHAFEHADKRAELPPVAGRLTMDDLKASLAQS